MKTEFKEIENWGKIRGINSASFQAQYQRCLQEIVEIHDAYNNDDIDEIADAIGDSIVTLINLAITVNLHAEDCLKGAFDIIELRKGINKNGSFVRYAKLTDDEKAICDLKQGNIGNQYFEREMLDKLEPKDFEPKDFIK